MPFSGRLGVPGEFLLTVGTLEPRKNVDRLVRAFGQVRGSLPGPVAPRDRRAGRVGPRAGGTPGRGPCASSPAPSPTPSWPSCTGRARAFAYVPLTEGYGLPPLEAMRVGVPTVVSDEVPERARPRRAGPAPARIVDPLDVDDIAGGARPPS